MLEYYMQPGLKLLGRDRLDQVALDIQAGGTLDGRLVDMSCQHDDGSIA